MPCAPPCAFIPTAGRQHTTVGDATGARPSGTSTTTATLPASPLSQCSLCASNVVPGTETVSEEHRSAGGGGGTGGSV